MLRSMLQSKVQSGRVTLVGRNGPIGAVGPEGQGAQPDVSVRLRGRLTALKLALNPDRFLGEAYTDGDLVMERGTIEDLLEICGRNFGGPHHTRTGTFFLRLAGAVRKRARDASLRYSRRNVAHHYDLSERLYRLFLDEDLQYSCGYFTSPDAPLDAAQMAKKRHIAAKLLLRPGDRVLDIGCGWGGLALSLAQMADVHVLGITLSQEQLRVARQRAKDMKLDDRVTFELQDYRTLDARFDRVVSVGMFEHVGKAHYGEFFGKVHDLLNPGGVALVHSIGRAHGPSATSQWLRKYIFPGGYIPALSEVMPAIERSGLWTTDLEILRLHYAETLRQWRERFLAEKNQLRDLYDERFFRMWEFYLAASEMGFRHYGMMVFQVQLAREVSAVPLTRDYMVHGERALSLQSPEAADRLATSLANGAEHVSARELEPSATH